MKNVRFTIEGRPGTVFDLRKGMTVSAEKIVEEPDVEITADTTVVGHAPTAALQASAPQPAAPETASPGAAQPTTPETGGTATSKLLWLGLIALLIVVAVIVVRSLK